MAEVSNVSPRADATQTQVVRERQQEPPPPPREEHARVQPGRATNPVPQLGQRIDVLA